MRYGLVEQNFNIDETTGLRTDKTILLTGIKSKKLFPEKLCMVAFYGAGNGEVPVFLTNNFETSALEKVFEDTPKMQSEYNGGQQ